MSFSAVFSLPNVIFGSFYFLLYQMSFSAFGKWVDFALGSWSRIEIGKFTTYPGCRDLVQDVSRLAAGNGFSPEKHFIWYTIVYDSNCFGFSQVICISLLKVGMWWLKCNHLILVVLDWEELKFIYPQSKNNLFRFTILKCVTIWTFLKKCNFCKSK